MTHRHHRLILTHRGTEHVHVWAASCAEKMYRTHVAAQHARLMRIGPRWRQVTPAERLPVVLRGGAG